MTRRRRTLAIVGAVVLVGMALGIFAVSSRARQGRKTTKDLRADIAAMKEERDRLRPQVVGALSLDPRISGMPDRQLRVGIPTTLARELIEKVVVELSDNVTLQLGGFRIQREGDVRRVFTIGRYDLRLRVTSVTAHLSAGTPAITFGGNRIGLVLPVRLASGAAKAAIDFHWDGRNVGGAVCGDMDINEVVTGTVRPASYRLAGDLRLSSTPDSILVTPKFPPLQVVVPVVPTKASWDLVQKILDGKGGLCGFVLDRVNIMEALGEMFAKGFSVRVPTERMQAVSLPIGIASTLSVLGTPVRFSSTAGSLATTDQMIWVGANVELSTARPR